MRHPSLLPAVALAAPALAAWQALAAPAADTPAQESNFYQLHIEDGHVVEVRVPADERGPEGHYEIIISRGDERAARLEGRRLGYLEDSWMTDLDADGAFEVVTVERLIDGGEEARLQVHEWTDGLYLLPVEIAPLEPRQRRGYRGHDQYAVEDGTLLREFPRFEPEDPAGEPSGGRVRLRYDFAAGAWRPIEEDGGWLDALPFVGGD